MDRRYYALLHDPYAAQLKIGIYEDHHAACRAGDRVRGCEPEIQRFAAQHDLLNGSAPIHLAISYEDEGPRIQAAFNSIMGLRTFLLTHSTESPCHAVIAWPGVLQLLQEGSERSIAMPAEKALRA